MTRRETSALSDFLAARSNYMEKSEALVKDISQRAESMAKGLVANPWDEDRKIIDYVSVVEGYDLPERSESVEEIVEDEGNWEGISPAEAARLIMRENRWRGYEKLGPGLVSQINYRVSNPEYTLRSRGKGRGEKVVSKVDIKKLIRESSFTRPTPRSSYSKAKF